MIFVFVLLLVLALFLQTTVFAGPLMVIVFLLFYVKKRSVMVFLFACIFGLLLDSMSVRAIGLSSIFFLTFLFVIMLYEKKFEIDTYPFVLFASSLGSMVYTLAFFTRVDIQSIFMGVVSIVLFFLLNRIIPQKLTRTFYEV
jgi:cell shape-determining protein MreD